MFFNAVQLRSVRDVHRRRRPVGLAWRAAIPRVLVLTRLSSWGGHDAHLMLNALLNDADATYCFILAVWLM